MGVILDTCVLSLLFRRPLPALNGEEARVAAAARELIAQGSATLCGVVRQELDFLLCGLSLERGWPIFTTDADFSRYARVLPLRLWRPSQL